MSSHFLSLSRRIRKTHFTDRVIENGVKGFTVYNHMLLPTYFESVEDDYHHLKREVQIWDVSCERQVEIDGKDSFKLLKIITPRNLEKLSENKCLYVPLVNSKGLMVNDPVIVKISDYKFWISIADSDVLLWIDGIVSALNLDVKVTEPDISPLAIQGPKSELLASRLFGSKITNLKLFDIESFNFAGEKLLIAKSGYSKQGGYEIYVNGPKIAIKLWDALFEEGKAFNVRAGCPNLIERIEGGLLSYGNDMTIENTPFECGLEKFLQEKIPNECISARALNSDKIRDPKKIIRSISIDYKEKIYCESIWKVVDEKNNYVGQITSGAFSPDFNKIVALGMINKDCANNKNRLFTLINGKKYLIHIHEKPFI